MTVSIYKGDHHEAKITKTIGLSQRGERDESVIQADNTRNWKNNVLVRALFDEVTYLCR